MRHKNAFIATVAVNAAMSAMASAQEQGQFHGPHMWSGGWHGWFFGPIMMIVFLAVAVIVVVAVLRWLGGPSHAAPQWGPPTPMTKAPLDILKERFARGEIDKEEYEERRKILGE